MRTKTLLISGLLITCILTGCTPKTKSMEVNVTLPESIEQGEQQPITWEQLALLTTTPSLRKSWDDILKITPNDTGKNGILFVDVDGNNEPNNTLRVAMHNREFTKQLKDEATRLELANASASEYADIEVTDTDKAVYMGINGYFNLLPDNTPNYSNPDSTITRSEFMAMVYRAETPVQDIESDDTFTTAVGESEYNVYAQSIAEDSYLDITSKSLNNLTYNGTITRAEAVYLLMQHYFSSELATVETKGIKFEDAKDSGKATETTGDYSKSDALNSALQNPDKGMPTELYKALALAKEIGLVGTETRWDEGLTKSEAVELTLIALENEKGMTSFSFAQGKTSDTIEETETVVEDIEEDPVVDEAYEQPEETGASTYTITDMDKIMYATKNCNVRKGPDADTFEKIGALNQNEEVHVTGKVNEVNWYRISLADGSEAYVSGTLLSETKATAATPKPSTSQTQQPAVSEDPNVIINSITGEVMKPGEVYTDPAGMQTYVPDWSTF